MRFRQWKSPSLALWLKMETLSTPAIHAIFARAPTKQVFIDGGRDHCRHDLTHEIVKLRVFEDKVLVAPRESKRTVCEVSYTEEIDRNLAES